MHIGLPLEFLTWVSNSELMSQCDQGMSYIDNTECVHGSLGEGIVAGNEY